MIENMVDMNKILDHLGLALNDKTGGAFYTHNACVNYGGFNTENKIVHDDGLEITLLDGDLFLKSLQETEEAFNIKFFVTA